MTAHLHTPTYWLRTDRTSRLPWDIMKTAMFDYLPNKSYPSILLKFDLLFTDHVDNSISSTIRYATADGYGLPETVSTNNLSDMDERRQSGRSRLSGLNECTKLQFLIYLTAYMLKRAQSKKLVVEAWEEEGDNILHHVLTPLCVDIDRMLTGQSDISSANAIPNETIALRFLENLAIIKRDYLLASKFTPPRVNFDSAGTLIANPSAKYTNTKTKSSMDTATTDVMYGSGYQQSSVRKLTTTNNGYVLAATGIGAFGGLGVSGGVLFLVGGMSLTGVGLFLLLSFIVGGFIGLAGKALFDHLNHRPVTAYHPPKSPMANMYTHFHQKRPQHQPPTENVAHQLYVFDELSHSTPLPSKSALYVEAKGQYEPVRMFASSAMEQKRQNHAFVSEFSSSKIGQSTSRFNFD